MPKEIIEVAERPAGVSLLTDQDIYLFNEGNHYRIYDKLGSHLTTVAGKPAASRGSEAWNACLARAESYLLGKGLKVTKDVVLSDDIATAILDYSARMRADIIALATSGSGGMSRFVFGTVADQVTRKTRNGRTPTHSLHSTTPYTVVWPSGSSTMSSRTSIQRFR